MDYTAGIDIGASATKAVIIDRSGAVFGHGLVDSGANFESAAREAFNKALRAAKLDQRTECTVVTTGYGRRNVPYANFTRTEISCHAEGSYFHFRRAHTLIDIGGQDSKVIRIDDSGKRVGFKMNRKCAAGTGAFLEEIANRLRIGIGELNGIAAEAEHGIRIGSYCTVFTATEILARIREGTAVTVIVKGIFDSVIERIVEMEAVDGAIVMTGGVVAHNPFLVEMFRQKIGKQVFVPPLPQFTGAFGAALYAYRDTGGQDA